MDTVAGNYRAGLIESVIFLALFLLAFGAVTVLARERWLKLGVTESLLVRLATSILLAAIAVGGPSDVVIRLLQGTAFSDVSLTIDAARNQAVLGIALSLAVTLVGVIRIEMYHRRIVSPPAAEEDADWKVEPPELAGRR